MEGSHFILLDEFVRSDPWAVRETFIPSQRTHDNVINTSKRRSPWDIVTGVAESWLFNTPYGYKTVAPTFFELQQLRGSHDGWTSLTPSNLHKKSWNDKAPTFILTEGPGGRLNIKMSSYQYGDPHVKDKTVVRPSYLKHGNPHTWERRSLYWDRTLEYNESPQFLVLSHRRQTIPYGALGGASDPLRSAFSVTAMGNKKPLRSVTRKWSLS